MKKNDTLHSKSKRLILAALYTLFATALVAQTEKSRTVEKVFDGKTALWASHRYGDLVLKKGTGTQIKAVLTITASSKDEEDLQQFLNSFDLQASDAPDNKVDLKTSDIICSWNTVAGRSKIKFNNGQSFSGIQKFKMTLEVYVPKLRYATLENKYAAIKAEEGTATTVEIKLFDGTVDAPGSFENLTLDMKYGKGSVGNFSSCTGQLYDFDLTLGNGGNLTLDSKYSGLKVGNLQALKLECFDDDYKIGSVSGPIEVHDKYSEFRFGGDMGNATLTLYDSKWEAKNAGDIRVPDSKYSEFEFQEINSLHFDASFDDAVQLAKVGTLSANESKYTEYTAEGLWKSLNFPSSFDDAIRVRSVGSTFEGLTFDGKYTDITLPIPATVKYEISAYLRYGKILFPERAMETTIYTQKDDVITLQAKVRGAAAGAPTVSFKSFDAAIKLN